MLIGAMLVVAALGYLGYTGFVASAGYSLTVGEFIGQQNSYLDRNIRLSGTVAPGSIEQKGLSLKFAVTDGQQSVPVTYQGAVPDTFKAGGDVTVEGRMGADGVFNAQTVMPKCPSRYVAR